MSVKPFVTMEAGNITAQVQKIGTVLDNVRDDVVAAAGRALDAIAEDMLAQAQAAAPVDEGKLQESGTTEPLVLEGNELVKRWGFNLAYARIRDQGGTILPKNGRALSIPISDEAKKLASPLEMGDRLKLVPINGKLFLVEKEPKGQGRVFKRSDFRHFHWQLVPSVTQEGNGYVTKTVEARKADVPRLVSDEVGKAIGGAA